MTTSIRKVPGRIFISYRREDTGYAAGWLYDRLAEHFGEVRVFKDVDSIQLGGDFVQEIVAAVGSCVVLLALIGKQWLTAAAENVGPEGGEPSGPGRDRGVGIVAATCGVCGSPIGADDVFCGRCGAPAERPRTARGATGQRRIDDPADFVRMEIEAALTRDVRIIPVLVDGTPMPQPADLPASLEGLARRQAVELRATRFASDLDPLLKELSKALAVPLADRRPRDDAREERQRALDVGTFSALNPREAARRLAGMPHDDAFRVLVAAPIGASAEALGVLLSDADSEGLGIWLLAGIRRSRAEELIATIPSAAPWLEQLPAAVEAIELCKPRPGKDLGVAAGPLARASASPQGTEGFYQNFRTGQIHWIADGGAQATTGAIAEYHIALGGSGGRLGFPLTPDREAATSRFGTPGSYQRFEGLQTYPEAVGEHIGRCGATIYWSSEYGPHATWGGIGACYELNSGTAGRLGFPVADEIEAGPSHFEAGGTVGWSQRFEGGAIYYSAKTKAIVVYEPIAEYHESHGGVTSQRGFPVSPELEAAESPDGTLGHLQRFEGAWAYPEDILKCWSDQEGPGGATIYTSEAHGTYCVGWGNGVLYERLNGTKSWLGFPKSDEVYTPALEREPPTTIQEFEGGTIFFAPKYDSVPVKREIMDYLLRNEGLRQRIGFPVAEERSLTSEGDEWVQFFEHGVLTGRNGLIEAWLRADSSI